MVDARLKRYVGGGTARPSACGAEGVYLSMMQFRMIVEPFPDDFSVSHNDAAYGRIGTRQTNSTPGQRQSTAHKALIHHSKIARHLVSR
jgi:hypothetical protein